MDQKEFSPSERKEFPEQESLQEEAIKEKERRGFLGEVWDWTKAIAIALLLAYLIRTFLFVPTIVDGESMIETLQNQERLIVNKIVYLFHPPQRGDIIVFHAIQGKDFIKRVIGVAGDRIEMKGDRLYINGKEVPETYLEKNKAAWKGPGPYTNDFTVDRVPDGTVFVLGDNRVNSTDSRILGPISLDRVVGRADLSFWPIDQIRLLHSWW